MNIHNTEVCGYFKAVEITVSNDITLLKFVLYLNDRYLHGVNVSYAVDKYVGHFWL